MSHSNSNGPLVTMLRLRKSTRQNRCHDPSNINGMKKSSSIDMMAAILTLKKEQFEDTTICTSPSYPSTCNERSTQDSDQSNSASDVRSPDVDSHDAIVAPLTETNDPIADDRGDHKVVTDIPTVITNSSELQQPNENNDDDDCSNDTVSTLGVDCSLNGNPRSIFSNYWDGKNESQVPSIVRSRAFSFCTSQLTASVPPCAIHTSNGCETKSLAAYEPKSTILYSDQGYDQLNLPTRRKSMSSKIEDYEMALRGNEDGRTIIPRAAALNDQRDKNLPPSKTESTDDTSVYSETGESTNESPPQPPSPVAPLHPSPPTYSRRNIFANTYYNSACHLPSYRYSNNDNIMKVSSTSALLPTPRRQRQSCLRPLSRSLSVQEASPASAATSEGKVTFDPTVRVVEYDRPHTMQASDGWSKWFV